MKKILTIFITIIFVMSLSFTVFAVNPYCSTDCECCTSGYCSVNLFKPILADGKSSLTDINYEYLGNGTYHFWGTNTYSSRVSIDIGECLVDTSTYYNIYMENSLGFSDVSDASFKVCFGRILSGMWSNSSSTNKFANEWLNFKPSTAYMHVFINFENYGNYFDFTVTPFVADTSIDYESYVLMGCSCPVIENIPIVENVYIKENRPLFDTPLSDYTVTEGLLLLLLVTTVLGSIFKTHIRG